MFFKIGLFTFGGGYAMLPLIEEAVVKKNEWLTADELLDMIAVADSTPGPVAINSATYVGYRRRGVPGAIGATAGVVLPSLIILFAISLFFDRFLEFKPVAAAFRGIKVAVAVLILRAAWSLWKKVPHTAFSVTLSVLSVLGVLLINLFSLGFSTLWFILIGAVLGLIAAGVTRLHSRKRGDRP
ncbi:MAG: chromate transporter [Clostridia bacterium]|nr:chromate transporter [Clostridia bacterium]